MELLQELLSTLFIIFGVIFMIIAALGILRLPDFYIRMSAITKAGTMGVGLIVVGIAIYFNELLIATKSFVIISFMMLTAPVGAHIIARAAYKQGVPFWKNNLVDELNEVRERLEESVRIVDREPENIKAKLELIDWLTSTPSALGGSLRKAVFIAEDIKCINEPEGFLALGRIYCRSKLFGEAEQEFISAVKASGNRNSYRYALGQFYREAGRYDEAFRIFEEIYKTDKREKRVLFEIGKTAALSGNNLSKGKEFLNDYLNIQPPLKDHSLSRASYYMGLIFIKSKEFNMAKEYLAKSLEYDPGFYDGLFMLEKIRKK